jgi:hypothetical protein
LQDTKPTSKILLSSGSFYNEYLLVVDPSVSNLTAFFLPPVPYLVVNPPFISNYSLYTQQIFFEVRVKDMNNHLESIPASLNVLNSQTTVTVNGGNAGYLFNSNNGAVTSVYVDDYVWTTGSVFNYTLTGGNGQKFSKVINHLEPGA